MLLVTGGYNDGAGRLSSTEVSFSLAAKSWYWSSRVESSPEVRIRKGTESGLGIGEIDKKSLHYLRIHIPVSYVCY